MPEPIALCFSGGKDSCLALQELRRQGRFEVVELVTTVTDAFDRVSMHGVRRSLLREQADSIGLPLTEVVVPPEPSNVVYEREMGMAFGRLRERGIRRVGFGDLFLEDLREYRERQLSEADLLCEFPIWHTPTDELARTFIRDGFRAVTVCVNPAVLPVTFAGRAFDDAFLADLPAEVDPCGENGEFHTFVSDGPIFDRAIEVEVGEVTERDGFGFCDLLPADSSVPAEAATG